VRTLPSTAFILVVPLALLMLVAFDVPLALMLGRSVTDPNLSFENYQRLVEAPAYVRVLARTFEIALATAALCVLFGYPLAYWMRRLSTRARLFVLGCIVLPFWTSILVRTYAWIVILGNNGVVNRMLFENGLAGSPIQFLYNEVGVLIGTVNVLLPFLVLPLSAAMMRIDERLLQAAASLGASDRTIFWRVFFPLTLPAVSAGAILVFILTLGFYITPAVLGGGRVPMVANMLDTLINRIPRWGLASAISALLLLITVALYMAYQRLGGKAST
jgi:ABC-type spermidine/putrescine transport system permease subunit I